MAWESGFFNSVNGDRLYNADSFNKFLEGLISNGVFESVGEKLAVQPNTGMTVQIGTGKGFFNNHWIKNTSKYLLVLEDADVVLDRYAAIVIRVDETNSVRDVIPTVKYSDFASTPVKPAMTREETVNEYCLAYVYINAGATTITAADIEDTRFNTELCGWVTGLIEQVETTTLYTQWETIFNNWLSDEQTSFSEWMSTEKSGFNDWFGTLQNLIDENVEATLVNALPTSATGTLSVDGWSQTADGYTQDLTVANMNDTKSVFVEAKGVECIAQSTNTLTFKSETLPTEAIAVKVVHMGV